MQYSAYITSLRGQIPKRKSRKATRKIGHPQGWRFNLVGDLESVCIIWMRAYYQVVHGKT